MSTSFTSVKFSINGIEQPAPLYKRDFLQALEEGRLSFDPRVEGRFAVQRGPNNYMYRILPYGEMWLSYKRGDWQHHHEMLHGPCKMFFDIDLKEGAPKTHEEQDHWLEGFFTMLLEKLQVTSSLDDFISEWVILSRARHPESMNGQKFSLHLIRNDRRHYASPEALGVFLKARLTVQDFKEWGIDDKYHDGNLQPIGACKYDEGFGSWPEGTIIPNRNYYVNTRPPMFDFHPVMQRPFNEVTIRQFSSAFVNWLHPESQEVSVALPPKRQFHRVEHFYGEHQHLVEAALAKIRGTPGNEDAEIEDVVPGIQTVRVELKFAQRCCHLAAHHAPHGSSCVLRISVLDEAVTIQCPCRPPVVHQYFFLNAESEAAHHFVFSTLPEIRMRGHDRPDFPIFKDEVGRRALPFDWHVTALGYRQFWFHPPRRGTGMAWSEQCWKLLMGHSGISKFARVGGYRELMVTYANLFFCHVNGTGFVQRTPLGYSMHKESDMKNVQMAKLIYEEEEEYGRPDKEGNRMTRWKNKKFFLYWVGNGRRDFAAAFVGAFDPKHEDFNLLPPSATNVTQCHEDWERLRPESAIRNLVVVLWDRYLDIIVGNELPAAKASVRLWVERWVLEVLFRVGYKTFVNLWLVSSEHGTGKSSLFEFCVKVLGHSLAIVSKSILEFVQKHFNVTGNRPLVFFDDAIPEKMGTGPANAFKNLVTNLTFTSATKFGEEHTQHVSCINMAFAINPGISGNYIPGLAQENERRNVACEIMSTKQQEEFFSGPGRYTCGLCEDMDLCSHSFASFSDFWTLFHEQFLGGQTTRGFLHNDLVGYLYSKFLLFSKGRSWRESLQMTMPVCQAILKHQETALTDVAVWFDDSLKRKYHVCPFGGAEDVFQGAKGVYWPTTLELMQDGDSIWLEGAMPVKTLLAAYRIEQHDKGKREVAFCAELRQLFFSRFQKPLEEVIVECKSWCYKFVANERGDGGDYKWVQNGSGTVKQKCLKIPKFSELKQKTNAPVRRSTLAGADFRLDLLNSRSGLPRSLTQSLSAGSLSDHEPDEEQPSLLKRLLDEANANDGVPDHNLKKAKMVREEDLDPDDFAGSSDSGEDEEDEPDSETGRWLMACEEGAAEPDPSSEEVRDDVILHESE